MHRLLLALWVSLSALGFAAPLGAEPVEWDQPRVTALAADLLSELDAALAAAADSPEQESVRQQRQRDAAVGQVKRVRQHAEKLLSELRAGRGLYQTQPYFRVAHELASETFQIAGDAVPFEEPIRHWKAAGEIAQEMSRYYEPL